MTISWAVTTFVVILVNTFICLSFYWLQQRDIRQGLYGPGTLPNSHQKFLLWGDFSTFTWGDLLGLVGMQIAFVHNYSNVGHHQLLVGGLVGFFATLFFLANAFGENHKADFGFPALREISLPGKVHLPYFGLNCAIGFIEVWQLYEGTLRGPLMWIALGGAAIWTAAAIQDYLQGRYDPYKVHPPVVREEKNFYA